MPNDRHLSMLLDRACTTPRERAARWRRLATMLAQGEGAEDPVLVRRALELLHAERDSVSPAARKLVAQILSERPLPPDLGALFASEAEELLLTEPAPRHIAPTARPDAPARPATPRAFTFETDELGIIRWVSGAPRALMIGRRLAGPGDDALVAADVTVGQASFHQLPMTLAVPWLEGREWRVSARAIRDSDGVGFLGYRGRAVPVGDEAGSPSQGVVGDAPPQGGDLLRELAHEVKTPLNAIIGFAEIIDGQFLGPAHRPYRQRAAGIALQARRLLSAVADLDLAGRLEAEGALVGEGSEFATLFPKVAAQVHERADARGVGFLYRLHGRFSKCALAPQLTERLVLRLAESMIGVAGEGESLVCTVEAEGRYCLISIVRPAALRDVPAARLLDPDFDPSDGQRLGIGFSLRLLRGLAGLAKGKLRIRPDAVELLIPGKVD